MTLASVSINGHVHSCSRGAVSQSKIFSESALSVILFVFTSSPPSKMKNIKVEKDKEKREWTDDEVLQLISLYKKHEFLWNVTHKSNKNRDKKMDMLDEIATKFTNCDGNEVQRKIHNLRNQVSQELKKMKKMKIGDGTDEKGYNKWKFFNALEFIVPYITTNNVCNVTKMNNTLDQPVMSPDEETPNLPAGQITKNKKKRPTEAQDDYTLKKGIQIMKKPKDEYDRFGEYVALELRSLKSDFYRGQLKGDIRRAIINICELDERKYWSVPMTSALNTLSTTTNSSSTSTPIPSPNFLSDNNHEITNT